MSDLFLGSMLSLVLLVPVLLRPFLKNLQRIEGITILPLISIATCSLICAGSGFRVSLLPVVLFCLIAFISTLARLVRHAMHLPTDWFSPLSTVWHVVLILGLVATVYASWTYRPELAWIPAAAISETTRTERIAPGVTGKITVYEPAAQPSANERKVVLFFGNGVSPGRQTAERLLASEDWTVVDARFRAAADYRNPLLALPVMRDAAILLGEALSGNAFFTDDAELASVRRADLIRLVRFTVNEYGNIPLYIIAEGDNVGIVSALMAENRDQFAGTVFILSEEDASARMNDPDFPSLVASVSGIMPSEAGSYPVIVLTGESRFGYGYGEICAEDFLSARLLGTPSFYAQFLGERLSGERLPGARLPGTQIPGAVRDTGRKQAELTARRVATCLAMRRAFNDHD
jgi:hypothetical protein